MQPEEMAGLSCPRCTAPVAREASRCARCGLGLESTGDGTFVQATGPVCPRCDRGAVIGDGFRGSIGRSEHGSCGHCGTPLVLPEQLSGLAYEEKSRRCEAFELENLARRESVDGWQLMDTTVDPAAPDRIVAHFRRYEHRGRPSRAAEARDRTPTSKPSRFRQGKRRTSTTPTGSRTPSRREPSADSRSGGPARRSTRSERRSTVEDVAMDAARRAVEAASRAAGSAGQGARSSSDVGSTGEPKVRGQRSQVPRDPRSRARAAHRQAKQARRQAREAARQARRAAKRKRRALRARHRGPAARHAAGALQGGATAVAGLLALALHLALFAAVFALRYVALPLALLGLRLAGAIIQAVFEELVGHHRRRPRMTRRRHARWA